MFNWLKKKKKLYSFYFVIETPGKITETFLIKDESKNITEKLIIDALKMYGKQYGFSPDSLKLINVIGLKE